MPYEVPVTLLFQPVLLGHDELLPAFLIWSLKRYSIDTHKVYQNASFFTRTQYEICILITN